MSIHAEDSRILHATETRNTKHCGTIHQLACTVVVINALTVAIQTIILPLKIFTLKLHPSETFRRQAPLFWLVLCIN